MSELESFVESSVGRVVRSAAVGAVSEVTRRTATGVVHLTTESLDVQSEDNATCALAKAKKFLQCSRNNLSDAASSVEVFMHALPVEAGEADEAAFRARLKRDVKNAEKHISTFQDTAQKATEQTAEAKQYVETNVVPARNRNQIFKGLLKVVGAAASGIGLCSFCGWWVYGAVVGGVVVPLGLVAGCGIYFVGCKMTAADPAQPFTELATMSDELSRDATTLRTYATECNSELEKLKTTLSRGETNLESVKRELNELREKVVAANREAKRIIEKLSPYLHPERKNV